MNKFLAIFKLLLEQRPTIYVFFLEYTQTHEKEGLGILRAHADRIFPNFKKKYIVIDNAIGVDPPQSNPEYLRIAGDNSTREFSGWDKAIKRFGPEIQENDLIILANDTFHRNYGSEYIKRFNFMNTALSVIGGNLVGYCDSYPEPVNLEGLTFQTWIRTSLVFGRAKELLSLFPISTHLKGLLVFSDSRDQFFSRSAPLSQNYQAFIKTWLLGTIDHGSSFKEIWHSAQSKKAEDLLFLQEKARSIISEHSLSARALKAGIKIKNVR